MCHRIQKLSIACKNLLSAVFLSDPIWHIPQRIWNSWAPCLFCFQLLREQKQNNHVLHYHIRTKFKKHVPHNENLKIASVVLLDYPECMRVIESTSIKPKIPVMYIASIFTRIIKNAYIQKSKNEKLRKSCLFGLLRMYASPRRWSGNPFQPNSKKQSLNCFNFRALF